MYILISCIKLSITEINTKKNKIMFSRMWKIARNGVSHELSL